MGMSRRAYAKHRNCSDNSVRKAIASGRIPLEADGTIDPAKADAAWSANTDFAKQRGAAADAAMSEERGVTPAPAAPAAPSIGVPGLEGGVSISKLNLAQAAARTKNLTLKNKAMEKVLVDRVPAEAEVFALGRQERDSWVNWPARIAADMAAELDVDPHTLEQVLDRYLRRHLESLAEIKVDLR